MNCVLPFPAVGVVVFPLNSTGVNGARNIKRNPSHMEILKEGKKDKKKKSGLFYFIFI